MKRARRAFQSTLLMASDGITPVVAPLTGIATPNGYPIQRDGHTLVLRPITPEFIDKR